MKIRYNTQILKARRAHHKPIVVVAIAELREEEHFMSCEEICNTLSKLAETIRKSPPLKFNFP